MIDDSRPIILEEYGPEGSVTIAIVTFNRPAQHNRLTTAMMAEFADVLNRLREAGNLSVLIVTGAGGVFSAGADLNEVAALNAATAYDFSRHGQALLAGFGEVAPVTIAAIDGYCLGGGLDIALSCDLRYASPASSFQHPGARRGIITGWGGTQRLPRLIGVDEARRLLILGERIDAQEALRVGLINRICENVLPHTIEVAQRISSQFRRKELQTIQTSLK